MKPGRGCPWQISQLVTRVEKTLFIGVQTFPGPTQSRAYQWPTQLPAPKQPIRFLWTHQDIPREQTPIPKHGQQPTGLHRTGSFLHRLCAAQAGGKRGRNYGKLGNPFPGQAGKVAGSPSGTSHCGTFPARLLGFPVQAEDQHSPTQTEMVFSFFFYFFKF